MLEFKISSKPIVFALVGLSVFLFQNCSSSGLDKSSDQASTQSASSIPVPAIALQGDGGGNLFEGQKIDLSTTIEDSELDYSWKYRPLISGPVAVVGSEMSLEITNAQVYQSGDYWLELTNAAGESVKSNEIAIVVNPSPFRTQPVSVKKNAGSTTTISAELKVVSGVNYTWEVIKPNQSSFSPVVANSRISGVHTAQLKITDTNKSDRGLYRLRATRGEGANARDIFSSTAHLTVVLDSLNDVSVDIDQPYTITFEAYGVKWDSGSVVPVEPSALKWERYDESKKQWDKIQVDGEDVTGKVLSISRANPKFIKYRAFFWVSAAGKVYSRDMTTKINGAYQPPTSNVFAVHYNHAMTKKSNGEYQVYGFRTRIRRSFAVSPSGSEKLYWYRKYPEDAWYSWILDGQGDQRESLELIMGHNKPEYKNRGLVEIQPIVYDKYWWMHQSERVALESNDNLATSYVYLKEGDDVNLGYSVNVNYEAPQSGNSGQLPPGTVLKWQKKNSQNQWVDLHQGNSNINPISVSVDASTTTKDRRVRVTIPNGNSSDLVYWHYFKVVKE